MFSTRLCVSTYGVIHPLVRERLLRIVRECYRRVGADLEMVDVYLVDSVDRVKALLRAEKDALGIGEALDEGFASFHDAWRGVPRITLCLERLDGLPRFVRVGSIRHEVGHSVLHGSLEYYVFNLEFGVLKMAERKGVSRGVLKDVLYLASVAVKDYEVTRFLQNHGYEGDQTALCLFYLKPSREDRVAWEMAKLSEEAKLLYLAAQLKPMAAALPLLESPRYGVLVRKGLDGFLTYLPSLVRENLSGLLGQTFPRFGGDTHGNVGLLTREVLTRLIPRNF